MTEQNQRYRFEILEGHIVHITHFLAGGGEECWNIYLENVFWGGRIRFPMRVESEAVDRILWMYRLTREEFCQTGEYREKGGAQGVVAVYANRKRKELYFILFSDMGQMYRRFLHFRHRWEKVVFSGEYLKLRFRGRLYSEKKPDMPGDCRVRLVIDQNHVYDISMPLRRKKRGYFCPVRVKIPLDSIVSMETAINNPIHIQADFGGEILSFNLGHKSKTGRPVKYNYVPLISRYYGEKALFIRGNIHQNWTLVVREKEEIERDLNFLFKESRGISALLFYLGKLARKLRRDNVNLFYEKNSMKAEEGTYQIFQEALGSDISRNYFILDSRSRQWGELSGERNVVEKYSWKYYWLLYTADYLISTETSSHLNVHRALNPYVRRALLKPQFFFLQHGVTYMKRQGAGSVFGRGKEGEPAAVVVCSPKEAEAVAGMLKIPLERCVDAGLPVFSTIEYGHISQESPDIVTIMLTWKPSEEHLLTHFQDSTYYGAVRRVQASLLGCLAPEQIRIVPHPKVLELLLRTDLAGMVWTDTVAEALRQTKLLITDYSSVCYNAFYQGAAVIFYQEDLEAYEKEVGKLVPGPEEYIGCRCFTQAALEDCLDKGIRNRVIRLDVLRTEEYVRRYREINRHWDGKNVQRIGEYLRERKVI